MKTKNFNLKHTLESGQFFRYKKIREHYYIVTHDKFFKARQEGDKLEFEGANKKFVQQFFGLTQDCDCIKKELQKDAHTSNALQQYNGLRILEQQPWQALTAFICSSASNIPKITMNVNMLAETFGKKINLDNETAHLFPEQGEMNDLQKIKNCKTGFRAKYLHEANKLPKDFLSETAKLKYNDALAKLTTMNGVGEKIADCTLLFGFKRFESFPVDVWIKRTIEELYFANKEKNKKEIKNFGVQKFGKYAGYANQYLYHWRRNSQDKY